MGPALNKESVVLCIYNPLHQFCKIALLINSLTHSSEKGLKLGLLKRFYRNQYNDQRNLRVL